MPCARMLRPGHRRHTAVCGADRQRVWARASVSVGVGSVGGELVERQCARQAKGHEARNTDRPGQPARADKTKGVRPWWCPLRQWYHERILPVFRSAGIIRSLKGHHPGMTPVGIPPWLMPSLTGCSITRTRLPSEESPCANGTQPSKTTCPQCNPINPGVAALRWGPPMGCSFRPDWVAGFLRIKWQLCTGLGGRNHRNTHPSVASTVSTITSPKKARP